MRRALALMLACTLLLPTLSSAATPKTTLQEVEREVMCTTCGIPLQVAESPAADAERRLIRELVAAGLTKRQIEDRLVGIYGAQVLAMPRDDTGLSITAYLLPAALVLVAAGLVAGAARTWRRRSSDDQPTPPAEAPATMSAAAEARVAADLEQYER